MLGCYSWVGCYVGLDVMLGWVDDGKSKKACVVCALHCVALDMGSFFVFFMDGEGMMMIQYYNTDYIYYI